ncbi:MULTISPECIES: alpha/beta hydrolase [Methylobacterium]|uniref:alpha/beta hydrolase n=1 Tax=Methylobacterium TaxID=407 RepID=UPI0013EC0A0F|nr:alpha/beta hydrolase [Methylobacterium sp. DB0501]NGM33414.1 alpha/beta hydrolase [Methylobacterium sp. DB0501]
MALHRRTLLTGAAGLALAPAAVAQQAVPAGQERPLAQDKPAGHDAPPETAPGATLEVLPLWPGRPPGGGGPNPDGPPFDESREGVVTGVAEPCLLVMRPARSTGSAMVIAAGGGYRRIDIGHEAVPVGRWLNGLGVTAFALVYRLPGEGWAAGADAPIQDALRAVRLVRARARRYGYEPNRVGVMGFSAGGHLMGSASTRFASPLYPAVDEDDALSARPDVAALLYPVITLKPPFDRTSSRRVLVGDSPTRVATEAYSVETQVRPETPPTFLAQAADDPIAVVDNSLLMFAALRAVEVPVEMHLFERGGHGFNLGVPGSPAAAWPGLFATWARRRGFIRV